MLLSSFLILLPFPSAALDTLSARQYDPGNDVDCKETSFTRPEWYLYDPNYTISNYSTGGTHGDVGFGAYNVATNMTFDCYARGVDLAQPINVTEWHPCSVPDTEFTFSVESNRFGLRQSWICDNAPGYYTMKTLPVVATGVLTAIPGSRL